MVIGPITQDFQRGASSSAAIYLIYPCVRMR